VQSREAYIVEAGFNFILMLRIDNKKRINVVEMSEVCFLSGIKREREFNFVTAKIFLLRIVLSVIALLC
jgi:hypothetical protein